MSDYEIEKNVPIPRRRGGSGRPLKWPELEVGESFFVPNGDTRVGMNALSAYCKRYGKGSACFRNVPGGIRIWRIA